MTYQSVKPNFFIVGAPKCGTTAICRYLSEHENVFFSEPKELFYWNFDFPGQQSVHDLRSLDRYLEVFQAADTRRHIRIGEGSTHYLRSALAIPEIMRFNPEAKIIAMLRDPMQVAPAYHAELVFNFQEDITDFGEAWRLRDRREADGLVPAACPSPHNLGYADFARFAPQVRRLFDHVPAANRIVILHEDFAADPRGTYQGILAFLGLPDDGRSDFPKIYAARRHRFEALARFYAAPPPRLRSASRAIRRAYHALVAPERREKVRGRLQVDQARAPLDPALRRDLAETFREDIAETAELLGRDLSHWGRA